MSAPRYFAALDLNAVQTVLESLFAAPYRIRELQACVNLPDSPLEKLRQEYNAQVEDTEWQELQQQLLAFYQLDSIPELVKQMSNDITSLQNRLNDLRDPERPLRAPREG